jgi:hypothetical protein
MSQLKDHIRGEKTMLRNVDGEHICLYRISGDENELRESLIKADDGEPLQGDNLLPNFLGMPILNPFYVVAEVIGKLIAQPYS